jgi:release factor glutamine methyltransferase
MFLKEIIKDVPIKSEKINEARIIAAHVIGRDISFLIARPEYKFNFFQTIKIKRGIKMLQKNIPLSYILGHKEFFGLDFFVNKNVLIPRPDTEIMVEAVIEIINQLEGKITLIDIGAGCGCVPIAIMKALKHKNTKTIATDICGSALRIAKKNSKKHNVKINFLRDDLFLPILKNPALTAGYSNMIITANLPYLTKEQFISEPSIQHEPKSALVSDNLNGLLLYKKLFEQIASFLPNVNYPMIILIEIDPRQSNEAVLLARKYFSEAKIETKKDLADHSRIVIIEVWPNWKQ